MPAKYTAPDVNERFIQCTTQLADAYFIFNDFQYAKFIQHHQLPPAHKRTKYAEVMSFQNSKTGAVYMLVDCAASRLGRDRSPFKRTLKLNIKTKGWNDEFDNPLINVGTNNLYQSNNKDVVWKTGGTRQLVLEEIVEIYVKDMMTSKEDRMKEGDECDIEHEIVELLDSDPEKTDDENDINDVVSGPDDAEDDKIDLSRFAAQYTTEEASTDDSEMVIDNNNTTFPLPDTLFTLESSENPLLSHPILYP